MTTQYVRYQFRKGTKAKVETATGLQAEPYYDTTSGHLWISNATSQIKIDPRGIVSYENEAVFFNDEIVLY